MKPTGSIVYSAAASMKNKLIWPRILAAASLKAIQNKNWFMGTGREQLHNGLIRIADRQFGNAVAVQILKRIISSSPGDCYFAYTSIFLIRHKSLIENFAGMIHTGLINRFIHFLTRNTCPRSRCIPGCSFIFPAAADQKISFSD